MKFKVISPDPAPVPEAEFYLGKASGHVYRISGNGCVDLETGIFYTNNEELFTNSGCYEPIYPGSIIQIEVE